MKLKQLNSLTSIDMLRCLDDVEKTHRTAVRKFPGSIPGSGNIFMFAIFVLLWFFLKNKLMKGKALRKHNLNEKTAASVLLKLFISSNELCHTTDAP